MTSVLCFVLYFEAYNEKELEGSDMLRLLNKAGQDLWNRWEPATHWSSWYSSSTRGEEAFWNLCYCESWPGSTDRISDLHKQSDQPCYSCLFCVINSNMSQSFIYRSLINKSPAWASARRGDQKYQRDRKAPELNSYIVWFCIKLGILWLRISTAIKSFNTKRISEVNDANWLMVYWYFFS